MGEQTYFEDGAYPDVDGIEGDWFNFGICLDGTNLIQGAHELFRATLKMRQEMIHDLPDVTAEHSF